MTFSPNGSHMGKRYLGPPAWLLVVLIVLSGADATWAQFTPGNVYIANFIGGEVFEYDASLNLVTSWPVGTQPAGMTFDSNGNLVVATLSEFCVFSAPGALGACHPKIQPRRTENTIFDDTGNLYTTNL